MAKAFKGVSMKGDVTADCANNVCTPFCRNKEEKYVGPEKLVCQKKGKKTRILPAKATLVCSEPRDTICGNLAPQFRFEAGHEGNIQCKKIKKAEECKVTCADKSLAPTLPKITCRVSKRKPMFVPPKAPPIKCQSPPPTPCGHFAPKYVFAKGNLGSISSSCKKVGKNTVCPVTCKDPTKTPSMTQVVCKAARRGKFAFSPPTGVITCKAPPPPGAPVAKDTHPRCGSIIDGPKAARMKIHSDSVNVDCQSSPVCVITCKEGGSWSKTSKRFVKFGKISVKCGKKGFMPKIVVAQCIGFARSDSSIMFNDEYELGPSNPNTKCYNTIYEKFNTNADILHVNCVGNKCTATCRETGEAPWHVWPDVKQALEVRSPVKRKRFGIRQKAPSSVELKRQTKC